MPALRAVLADPTFEIIPLASLDGQLRYLPPGARVQVTASPSRPIETTVDLATRLRAEGFDAIPHLAARRIRDEAHVRDLLTRIADAGITGAFVVGGDGDPVGAFDDGLALLRAMGEIGHPLDVGVPCYPQGHPLIPEGRLREALAAKAPFAAFMTTQLCFDPGAIERWIRDQRASGLSLPAVIGAPGPVDVPRLLSVAARIGVPDSRRFVRTNLEFVSRLVRSAGRYRPDSLLAALGPMLADPAARVRGIHVYTFNQLEATARWREAMLSALDRR